MEPRGCLRIVSGMAVSAPAYRRLVFGLVFEKERTLVGDFKSAVFMVRGAPQYGFLCSTTLFHKKRPRKIQPRRLATTDGGLRALSFCLGVLSEKIQGPM
jgi:hypothetical protein